ncbi:hypothetical protein [Streptomyces sp. SID11385]|uniref:hypothetical protein n=1 Tax=Streptomyces sp. SID11385 TaxID=2706031 RepID=UPI0013C61D0B|nr:hypothetical protein [Streptomyces sp. SID11385]NEA40069.1 hypothetical protein [Streptomyces sp. SID11385]
MGGAPSTLNYQVLRVPKSGNAIAECEDAAYAWHSSEDEGARDGGGQANVQLYAAVADGASESLLAGPWADRLARDVVESMVLGREWWRDVSRFVGDFMRRAETSWDAYLERYKADRIARGRPITWYEQPGLEKGAFATIVGAEVRGTVDEGGNVAWSWHAFALGDSCLFHLRDGAVLHSFPVTETEGFGITPDLLGSRNHDTTLVAERLSLAHGTLKRGDELLIASDALAAWLLSADRAGTSPGTRLALLAELGDESFGEWVDDQRTRGLMRNDDVTLVRLKV